jgi:hypothetical protein
MPNIMTLQQKQKFKLYCISQTTIFYRRFDDDRFAAETRVSFRKK